MLTLDQIVDMDDERSKGSPWNKLNKSLKFKRIMEFATVFGEKENMNEIRVTQLKDMLKDKLDRKCLHRVKDVIYDCELEQITSIPALICVQSKYTLRMDVTCPSSSLTPKKKTIKRDVKK